MIFRTKNKVDLQTAFQFEVRKGGEGIRKQNIFIEEDCYWELHLNEFSISTEFKAPISWYQIREKTIDPIYEEDEPIITEESVLMFQQYFELDSTHIQMMWTALTQPGSPFENGITSQDQYIDKMNEFVEMGILLWIGDMQNYFGLSSDGFEIIRNGNGEETPDDY